MVYVLSIKKSLQFNTLHFWAVAFLVVDVEQFMTIINKIQYIVSVFCSLQQFRFSKRVHNLIGVGLKKVWHTVILK